MFRKERFRDFCRKTGSQEIGQGSPDGSDFAQCPHHERSMSKLTTYYLNTKYLPNSFFFRHYCSVHTRAQKEIPGRKIVSLVFPGDDARFLGERQTNQLSTLAVNSPHLVLFLLLYVYVWPRSSVRPSIYVLCIYLSCGRTYVHVCVSKMHVKVTPSTAGKLANLSAFLYYSHKNPFPSSIFFLHPYIPIIIMQ